MAQPPNTLKTQPGGNWFPSGIPWAEYNGPHGTTAEMTFGYGSGNQCTMVIAVNWLDTARAIVDILGYPTAVFSLFGTGTLSRQPPLRHPLFDNLYASRITGVQQLKFEAKELETGSFSGASNIAPVSVYTFSLITVVFTQPKYVILTDAQVDAGYGAPRQEFRRWVEVTAFQPKTEVLQRRGGVSFRYTEGPSPGKEIPMTVNQPVTEALFVLVWHQVPRAGLFSSGGIGPPGSPTTFAAPGSGLLGSYNTVNNATFLGYPAGTLRVSDFRFTELESPVPASFLGLNPNISPPLLYDVAITFSWADPPPFGATHGHNLFPVQGVDTWSLATSIAGGNPLLPSSDYTQMFVMQA